MPYTQEDVDILSSLIKQKDPLNEIGHVRVSYTALGGAERASLFVHASLQKKEDWPYNIFHNADYAIFCLDYQEKMELISRHYEMPKMRKCKIKSLEDAAHKIVSYFINSK